MLWSVFQMQKGLLIFLFLSQIESIRKVFGKISAMFKSRIRLFKGKLPYFMHYEWNNKVNATD